MRRSALLLAMLAFGILAINVSAQKRPDFTGAWTAPPVGAAAAAGTTGSLGSGWGAGFTLRQDADTLVLERVFFARADLQPAMKLRFALDGSETRNKVLMGRGEQVQSSTCAWDGVKLVITTLHHVLDAKEGKTITSEVVRTLSLQRPPFGRSAWPPSLVVETVRSGALGGPPSRMRTVYNRN